MVEVPFLPIHGRTIVPFPPWTFVALTDARVFALIPLTWFAHPPTFRACSMF